MAYTLPDLPFAHDALEPGGGLYVVEMLLSDSVPGGGLLDLNMLVMTGGRERPLAEYDELLGAAGFRLESSMPTPSVASVLTARTA